MQSKVVLVMGVAGSGKTRVGRMLAGALGWAFADADDFHPPANVDKMRIGVALTEQDRTPWLDALSRLVDEWLVSGTCGVLACSALKQIHRVRLLRDPARMHVVYLKGTAEVLARRMEERTDHFMPVSLLASQLETLEEPVDALNVDIALPPERIVEFIRGSLNLTRCG